MMRLRIATLLLPTILVLQATISRAQSPGDFETQLLTKFARQNQSRLEHLKAMQEKLFADLKPLEESQPQKVLVVLRDFLTQLHQDNVTPAKEREQLLEIVQAKVKSLRAVSREGLPDGKPESPRIYKDYLEREALSAGNHRGMPRSYLTMGGEPANFYFSNGYQAAGILHKVGAAEITCTVRDKTARYASTQVPAIQVSGGVYLYDRGYETHFFASYAQIAPLLPKNGGIQPAVWEDSGNGVGPAATYHPKNGGSGASSRYWSGLKLLLAAYADAGPAGPRRVRDVAFESAARSVVATVAKDAKNAELLNRLLRRAVNLALDGYFNEGGVDSLREDQFTNNVTKWLQRETPGLGQIESDRLAEFVLGYFPIERERRLKSAVTQ